MVSTVYSLEKLKEMVREETKKVKESTHYRFVKVQGWWVMVHNNGANLSITFEVPNLAGGTINSITTRLVAL